MAHTRQMGPRVGCWATIYSVAPGLTRGPAFLLLVDRDNGAKEKGGWVYILADRYCGGMYVSVTADIVRRVQQHRQGTGSEHVARYGMTRLVYTERHEDKLPAIAREKSVKKWRREWKFALIEADIPDWLDLWDIWFPAQEAQV